MVLYFQLYFPLFTVSLNCSTDISAQIFFLSACKWVVFVSAVVVVVTLCCRPVWWVTPQFWGLWLPWCPMAMAFSTTSEMTGGQARHKRAFIIPFLHLLIFCSNCHDFCMPCLNLTWIIATKFYSQGEIKMKVRQGWNISERRQIKGNKKPINKDKNNNANHSNTDKTWKKNRVVVALRRGRQVLRIYLKGDSASLRSSGSLFN